MPQGNAAMIIIYEASILGMGMAHKTARTGIYHYIRNLANALKGRPDLQLLPACLDHRYLEETTIECQKIGLNISFLHAQSSRHYRLYSRLLAPLYLTSKILHKLKVKKTHVFSRALNGAIDALENQRFSSFFSHTSKAIHNAQLKYEQPIVLHETYRTHSHSLINDASKMTLFRCITIHDLIPIKFPKYFPSDACNEFKAFLEDLRSSDQIITVSESTKNDLLEFSGNKFALSPLVTPLAVDDRFRQPSETGAEKELMGLLHSHGIDIHSYVLSVATIEPRKNISMLIKAYSLCDKSIRSKFKLLLVGTKGWEKTDFRDLALSLGIDQSIVFTGYLDDKLLPPLLRHASLFCYPSLYEGFGLPVLEAMSCGCPVVTSNTSSLKEFFSEAAICVDPYDAKAISNAITEILGSPALANDLREAGLLLSRHLTWNRLADATINAYTQATH